MKSEHTGLVTLGEVMGALTAREAGTLAHNREFRLGIAGAEATVAVGVSRLGEPASWIGRLGNDEIGDLVAREFRAENVTMIARREAVATGLMLVTRRLEGLASVTYYRRGSAGSLLSPEDVDAGLITGCGVLHVTGITPALGPSPADAVHVAIEVARSAGVPVSFDVNYRSSLWPADLARPVFREMAKRADIVFATMAEAQLLVAEDDPARAALALSALGPRRVIVKLGPAGAVAATDGAITTQEIFPVPVVNSVGAGDGYVAGYLASFLKRQSAAESLRTAAAAAAFAVAASGDWEGLPESGELHLLQPDDEVTR
jgi:2-dehydro-3-deoxygluconokinase